MLKSLKKFQNAKKLSELQMLYESFKNSLKIEFSDQCSCIFIKIILFLILLSLFYQVFPQYNYNNCQKYSFPIANSASQNLITNLRYSFDRCLTWITIRAQKESLHGSVYLYVCVWLLRGSTSPLFWGNEAHPWQIKNSCAHMTTSTSESSTKEDA